MWWGYYNDNHQSYSALEAGCEIKHARDPAFRPGRRHGLLIKHRVPSRNWELYTRSWRDEQLFRRPDGAPGAADHACAGIVCKTGRFRVRRATDERKGEGSVRHISALCRLWMGEVRRAQHQGFAPPALFQLRQRPGALS